MAVRGDNHTNEKKQECESRELVEGHVPKLPQFLIKVSHLHVIKMFSCKCTVGLQFLFLKEGKVHYITDFEQNLNS